MESTTEEHAGNTEETIEALVLAETPELTSRPADRIRQAIELSAARGAPMVSAPIMQARLFSVYDDARAEPEALALVQRHLQLTLERSWYSAQEVEELADQLDWLLGLATAAPDLGEDEPEVDAVEPEGAPAE
jgi:uncharacterized protein YbjT (DUF2867 family)